MKDHFKELLKLRNVLSLEGPRYSGTSWSKKVIQASDEDAFETPPLRGVLVRPGWTKAEGRPERHWRDCSSWKVWECLWVS